MTKNDTKIMRELQKQAQALREQNLRAERAEQAKRTQMLMMGKRVTYKLNSTY